MRLGETVIEFDRLVGRSVGLCRDLTQGNRARLTDGEVHAGEGAACGAALGRIDSNCPFVLQRSAPSMYFLSGVAPAICAKNERPLKYASCAAGSIWRRLARRAD